jgi:hypothetical protein
MVDITRWMLPEWHRLSSSLRSKINVNLRLIRGQFTPSGTLTVDRSNDPDQQTVASIGHPAHVTLKTHEMATDVCVRWLDHLCPIAGRGDPRSSRDMRA